MSAEDDLYYKIYVPFGDEQAVIVEMQWFDESGYEEDRFLVDRKFESSEKAELFCLELYHRTDTPSYIKSLIKPLLPVRYDLWKCMTTQGMDELIYGKH